MPLRRTSVSPAGLHARRLNSLKSTGPRSARGKAWSCLNALRHGQRCRRRTFRDKLVRTGDSEAVYLFDLIFEELLAGQEENPSDFVWRRLESLAMRAWCIESGRRGRKVAKTSLRTKLESGVRIYRYGANLVVPRRLKIANKAGWGFVLINPAPSLRRRVASGWIPQVLDLEGTPPKARRVRGGCKPGAEIVRVGEKRAPDGEPEPKRSRWGAIFSAVGRIGSSIFQRLREPCSGGVLTADDAGVPTADDPDFPTADLAASAPPRRRRPSEDFWEDDPEDYESESPEEFLFRHKFLARLAAAAARRSRGRAEIDDRWGEE
jgi:hypothetical protein